VDPGVAPFETDWVKDGEDVGVVVWVCVVVREDVRLPVLERVWVFVPLEVIVNEGVWEAVCAAVRLEVDVLVGLEDRVEDTVGRSVWEALPVLEELTVFELV
jgi:hypothetical protein